MAEDDFTLTDDPVYFNGFQIGVANGDIVLSLSRNGKVFLTINSSYSVAKSFAEAISKMVSRFEREVGQEMLTIDQIKERREKANEEQARAQSKRDLDIPEVPKP